jgi:DNA-binding transcriptional LysR family regulator
MLTPEGERLRERATRILDDVAELGRLRDDSTGEMRGPVRIGAGEGPVLYLLPDPIRKFRKRHPLFGR